MEESAETSETTYVWPVKELEDLTPAQRDCAGDIIDAFHEAINCGYEPMVSYKKPAPAERPFVIAEREDDVYWRQVFADWDTSMDISKPDPALWVPSPKDLRHPLGCFKRDLPPSKCAQRKAKKSSKKVPQVRPERQAGAKAYIRARYRDESNQQFEFECCDETGKGADLHHVAFTMDESDITEDAKRVAQMAAAVGKHDLIVFSNASRFNAEYLRYLMRCRLMRILSDTVPSRLFRQRPPNPTASYLRKFWRPELIEMLLLKRPSTGERAWIQKSLVQLRSANVEDLFSMYDKGDS